MAYISASPIRSENISRSELIRRKISSPKIRDALRKRCRERIQNDRHNILSKFREVQLEDIVCNIVQEEWIGLEVDEDPSSQSDESSSQNINLERDLLLEDEVKEEQEQFLLEMYESLLAEESAEDIAVVCPICWKGRFEMKTYYDSVKVYCPCCAVFFGSSETLATINKQILDVVLAHNTQCHLNVEFSYIPLPCEKLNGHLCIVCHKCRFSSFVT